jgi:putative salt-induced outer membrane protein
MKKIFCAIAILLAAAGVASADTVVLKNGDHLTGTVVKSDGKALTLKTDFAGEINIDWTKVQELATDKPIYVVTPDKKVVSGTVTTQGPDLVVATANTGAVHIPIANVGVVRSESEEAAFMHAQHPGLLENWNVGANVGFALARGNSDTTNLSIGFTSVRTGLRDKLSAYASSIYAQSSVAGVSSVTADDVRGGARYDRDITSRLFGFGSGDFEYNSPQDLDLRSIYTGGFGYKAIKSETTSLDFLAGANYTREAYSTGMDRNIAGLTLGEDFMHKFGKSTTVTEQYLVYPELSGGTVGQYRFAFDMAVTTKISKWLGWQTTASDRYLSNPIPGTKTNDLILTTGLTVAFSH